MFRTIFLLMALSIVNMLLASQSMAQRSDAEGFGKMKLQSAGKKYGYSKVKFSDGSRAERFVLKSGDCPKQYNDCQIDRERIEFIDSRSNIKVGNEVWIAWSILVPADFPVPPSKNDRNILLGQIHQSGPSGPELMFFYNNHGLNLKLSNPHKLDDDPMRPLPNFRWVKLLSRTSMRGKWTRIMVNAKWSRANDGWVKVWVNGTNVWNYSGATTNANDNLHFKYGLYRSFVSRCGGPCPDLTVFYKNVKKGPSRVSVE